MDKANLDSQVKIKLGNVSVRPMGEYNPLTQYERLDLVSYKDGSYIVLKSIIGIEPIADDVNYSLIAGYSHSNEFMTLANQVRADAVKAQTSETNAKLSETNAGLSAEKAKLSETNAKQSADNAKQSELKAKTSEVLSANNAKLADVIAIKQNVKGNPIQISDSANYGFLDYEINGTTTQNGVPSPENPVEIVNGNINEISSNGKNLFDGILELGAIAHTNGELIETNSSKRSVNFTSVKPNTYYTLGARREGEYNSWIIGYDANKVGIKDSTIREGNPALLGVSAAQSSLTFQTTPTTRYIKFMDIRAGESLKEDIQIELGKIATPYEPYHGKTIILSQPVELSKWDRIIKKNGVWGKENNTATEILDGSADEDYSIWSFSNTTYKISGQYSHPNAGYRQGYKNIYCNKLKSFQVAEFADRGSAHNQDGISVGETLDKTIYINKPSFVNDISGFKAWLSQNPLTVSYHTAEPIFEPLPEIDQQALNSLETYYPETVVTTQGEQSLTYLADTKTYIDNKIKELNQAVISTGGNI